MAYLFLTSLNFWTTRFCYLLTIVIFLMLLDKLRKEVKTENMLKSVKLSPKHSEIDDVIVL